MEEGRIREFVMDMYTLLYFNWITNKDLLYSTWNFTRCYVAAWMGKLFTTHFSTLSRKTEWHHHAQLRYGHVTCPGQWNGKRVTASLLERNLKCDHCQQYSVCAGPWAQERSPQEKTTGSKEQLTQGWCGDKVINVPQDAGSFVTTV